MKAVVISVIVVLAMVQLMVKPGQAINCGQVDASLAPCLTYLRQGGTPPPLCCNGVRTITGMATTPEDKKAACQCVKDAASHQTSLNDDAAKTLPQKCGVKMDIPISPTTDCNAIKDYEK
ncbi:hypothetical protein RJ639_013436 [Escallonia herrerae]|uniref:Non-specific lipid-transfer protein n=1 Tax=Escallonia herrerae TaxID=1293975 RepID=A0AA88VHZ8_9ASTE|nr:hypothetical protein RJ639_013436 [Escallonia herrerae]